LVAAGLGSPEARQLPRAALSRVWPGSAEERPIGHNELGDDEPE
jgi:hypothetical protein